jgi:hypothetical protein
MELDPQDAVVRTSRTPPPQGPTRVTGWVGWMFFAVAMLVLVGAFQVAAGLVALLDDELFIVRSAGLVLDIGYTAWGWTHLAIGTALVLVAFGLLAARRWARIVATALAGTSAVVHFIFAPAYPVWSIVVITLDVIVIYALTAHGGEYRLGAEYR